MEPVVSTGQVWQHRNGNQYKVLMVVNLLDEERYPKTVVYENLKNGSQWSRPHSDWRRSFTFVNEEAHDPTP